MTLFVKPTTLCQFNCKFCSAALLPKTEEHHLSDDVKELISKFKPNSIICTGGEPLLVGVDYFNELLSFGDWYNVSITSNLDDFRKDPLKWKEIFSNRRIGVVTSFQYGDCRIHGNGDSYTENEFLEVNRLWEKHVSRTNPMFISVISNENERMALDHVYLAKRLNTCCRLNGVLPLGRSNEYYPLYKMLDLYFEIIDRGLQDFEMNVKNRSRGICPFNVDSKCVGDNISAIRDSDGGLRYSFCEDLNAVNNCTFKNIDELMKFNQNDVKSFIMGSKCLSCELCRLCNCCYTRRIAAKTDTSFCETMTKYREKLLRYGFKL